MEKIDVVKHILHHTNHGQFIGNEGVAWAPSNVALCKYWGKRDSELNLPITSSLSVSLGNKGAFTKIKSEGNADNYVVNGVLIDPATSFACRLRKFLDLFRLRGAHYLVEVDTNVPIAAGFASSACGFASLVQALNKLYDWRLGKKELSILARLGSGSACRSLFEGFVEWQKGDSYDGMDSYGIKLDYFWPELRLGMLAISTKEKAISSREAMRRTVADSPLYSDWSGQVAFDLNQLKLALVRKEFTLLGEITENNALKMHEIMGACAPPIVYSLPETLVAMAKIQEMRRAGVGVFFTQDAGPNLQLLFLAEDEASVLSVFPELEVVLPFADSNTPQIVLVNEQDVEIGVSEKLVAHLQGKLHRAFSIMVLRKRGEEIEVLLQQRSSNKYHSADLWSNTCCGHPKLGENLVTAATRRLREEMGFGVTLTEIGKFQYRASFPELGLVEHEIDHVLVGFSDLDEFPVNRSEVQDYGWVKLAELQQDLPTNPSKYTVWLPQVVQVLVQSFLGS